MRAAVIPCGAGKLDRPAPAGQLYTGGQHRLSRQAADALVDAGVVDVVLILSARHGLLRLDDLVAPYDTRITDAAAVSWAEVGAQLRQLDVDELVALLPKRYAAKVTGHPGIAVDDRLAGTRGLLDQRARLAVIKRGQAAA